MELIEQTERRVRERMGGQGAGHDMDHVFRVRRMARQIQTKAGGDCLIIELSALLHDIGDAKFHGGIERSAEFSREILGKLNAPPHVIDHVADIVDRISFRKGVDSSTLSLEGQIVQDADRLDALGAIGIVRTIEYGATFGQPFWSSDPRIEKTGVAHFHEKLFKLKSLMNTETARQIAIGRERFMQQFLQQYFQEWDPLELPDEHD